MSRTLTLPNLFLSPESRLSPSRVAAVKLPAARLPAARREASVRAFAVTEAPRRTRSLYEVLRVKRNASPTEIKTAYRTLAKLYHPDAAADPGSDGLDFIAIHDAYATLSDPAARELYDLSLGVRRRRIGVGSDAPASFGFYPTRRWETDQCW